MGVRPDVAENRSLLREDVPRHSALSVTEFLTSNGIPAVPDPVIPPELGPFNFFLNRKTSSKAAVSGHRKSSERL